MAARKGVVGMQLKCKRAALRCTAFICVVESAMPTSIIVINALYCHFSGMLSNKMAITLIKVRYRLDSGFKVQLILRSLI